jgi:hypothetical protein
VSLPDWPDWSSVAVVVGAVECAADGAVAVDDHAGGGALLPGLGVTPGVSLGAANFAECQHFKYNAGWTDLPELALVREAGLEQLEVEVLVTRTIDRRLHPQTGCWLETRAA